METHRCVTDRHDMTLAVNVKMALNQIQTNESNTSFEGIDFDI